MSREGYHHGKASKEGRKPKPGLGKLSNVPGDPEMNWRHKRFKIGKAATEPETTDSIPDDGSHTQDPEEVAAP